MNFSEIGNEGIWRNDGYVDEYEFLKVLGFQAVTLEYIPVKCQYDENLSTNFQMRHVIDPDGNRGFMCYVCKKWMHSIDTYRQGTTREIYDEVKNMGIAMQQEDLRRSWLNLNRR